MNSESRIRIECHSLTETESAAKAIADCLHAPLVIGLDGDLGAGKTSLVRMIATAKGVDSERVSSPTFTLIQEYPADEPVVHFDAYRLTHPDEFGDLGADDYFEDAICFVEWASLVEDWLPDDRLTVFIEVTGVESRTLVISASGSTSRRVLNTIRQRLQI